MNEFNTLRSLRSDVPLPSSDDLAPAHARLEHAMAAEATGALAVAGSGSRNARKLRQSGNRRLAWIAGSLIGVAGLVFGAGQAATAINVHQTNARLLAIARATVAFAEVSPGPGQYLLSTTVADWAVCETVDEGDPTSMTCEPNRQQIDVYMPTDPAADWVIVRDWGNQEAITAPEGSGHTSNASLRPTVLSMRARATPTQTSHFRPRNRGG